MRPCFEIANDFRNSVYQMSALQRKDLQLGPTEGLRLSKGSFEGIAFHRGLEAGRTAQVCASSTRPFRRIKTQVSVAAQTDPG